MVLIRRIILSTFRTSSTPVMSDENADEDVSDADSSHNSRLATQSLTYRPMYGLDLPLPNDCTHWCSLPHSPGLVSVDYAYGISLLAKVWYSHAHTRVTL